MILTEETLKEISGYKTRAALRKYVRRNGWKLLKPGKGGRVAAERIEKRRTGEPNFAAIQRREEGQ